MSQARGQISRTCGQIGQTCGQISQTCGQIGQTCGQISRMCGQIGQNCGHIGQTCGQISRTNLQDLDYADFGQKRQSNVLRSRSAKQYQQAVNNSFVVLAWHSRHCKQFIFTTATWLRSKPRPQHTDTVAGEPESTKQQK